MAIYSPVLTYTFRDSLSSGDPNKVIKGAYLDGEFNAIHTASLDAASLSGNNTFSGTQAFNGNVTFSAGTVTLNNGFTGSAPGTLSLSSTSPGLTINSSAANGNTQPMLVLDSTNSGSGYAQASFVAAPNVLGTSDFYINQSGSTSSASIVNRANANLNLGTNGVTRMFINGAGLVDISAATNSTSLVVSGAASQTAAIITGGGSTSIGLQVKSGGSGSTNPSLVCSDSSGSFQYFKVDGSGNITGYANSSSTSIDLTGDAGTFTGTLTGFGTAPFGTCKWMRVGNMCTLYIPTITGTSTTTSMTMTGLPTSIRPQAAVMVQFVVVNNGVANYGSAQFAGSGNDGITFLIGDVIGSNLQMGATGFATGQTKGTQAQAISYLLN